MNDNYITYIVSCWSHRESVTIKCCRACTAGRGSARRTFLAFRHRGQRPVPAFQSRVGLRVASDNNNQDGVEIYVNCNRRKKCSLVTPSAGPGPGQAEIRSRGPGRAEKFRPVQYSNPHFYYAQGFRALQTDTRTDRPTDTREQTYYQLPQPTLQVVKIEITL